MFINNLRLYTVLSSIVYDIFATMAEDWNEFASTRSKMQLMISKANLSHRFSKFSIGAYSLMLFLFGASNMIAQRSAGFEQPEEKQLIIKMKLPSECSVSPLYEIVMLVQFLLQFTSALVAGMLNAFIVTLVSWFCTKEHCVFP